MQRGDRTRPSGLCLYPAGGRKADASASILAIL
jgi:hypothetical protein